MTITVKSKVKLTPEERKQRVKDLYDYQLEAFTKLNIQDPLYVPKMAYVPSGKDERHIAFFGNELEKCESYDVPQDIYTEFVSSEYLSEDATRSLYKWKFNPHWRTEYDIIPATDFIQERYMVPVSELRLVYDNSERLKVGKHVAESTPKISTQMLTIPNEIPDDAPFNDLTIRDLVAIFTRKPVSNKNWLNKLINEL